LCAWAAFVLAMYGKRHAAAPLPGEPLAPAVVSMLYTKLGNSNFSARN
jgi:hypothetical protein